MHNPYKLVRTSTQPYSEVKHRDERASLPMGQGSETTHSVRSVNTALARCSFTASFVDSQVMRRADHGNLMALSCSDETVRRPRKT
jgi:hypothetical protein